MIATDFTGAIRKILRRLKHEKFDSVLGEWGAIESDTVSEVLHNRALKTKKAIVEGLLDICKNKKLTKKNVAELDLIYNYHHSENKKWNAFQLFHKSDAAPHVLQPIEFAETLKKQLSFYFKHDLCLKKVGEALWLRIGIHEGASSQLWLPSNVIYMIHHPQSQFIIISKVKVLHKDYLMQALLCTLQCSEIKELQLTGHSVDSLADLVLNRQSQGGFAKYRLNQVHSNPLNRTSRKRKATCEIDTLDEAVTHENTQERAQQEKQTAEVFGSHQQPKLQKLEYRLETRFRGTQYAPAMTLQKDSPFHCTVKFEGPSVLEGIKGLSSKGLASHPLPYHLSDVHTLAKNHFVLADRKKTTPPVDKRVTPRARTPAN